MNNPFRTIEFIARDAGLERHDDALLGGHRYAGVCDLRASMDGWYAERDHHPLTLDAIRHPLVRFEGIDGIDARPWMLLLASSDVDYDERTKTLSLTRIGARGDIASSVLLCRIRPSSDSDR